MVMVMVMVQIVLRGGDGVNNFGKCLSFFTFSGWDKIK
jgi:hypothetical protein